MEFVITSLGMVSSVGNDVITACASIRAGVTRPRPLDYFQFLDEETGEMVAVTGHPIRGLTEGFTILGRWMRLGAACVGDLVRQGELPPATDVAFWRGTGLLAVTPYHNDERLGGSESTPLDLVRMAYLDPLRASLKLPIDHLDLVPSGPAGAVEAIQRADRWLAAKGLERAIVLAADSYCDPLTLEWLVKHRRLKTADAPVGLAPGEAGACFLLESTTSARRRQARTQLAVEGVAVGLEKNHLFTEEINQGQALSTALGQTLAAAAGPFGGDLVCDLNGENWRAAELGYARVRLPQRLGEGLRLVLPALSLGDTGAASGAVSVCVAARALVRGYSRSDRVLIAASSERGHVGTLSLRRVN
jgi:3-oxoacyl-[acyl-carrier-protein] synthase-1